MQKDQMTNESRSQKAKPYDLGERTALFGESVIDFARTLPKDSVNNILVSQFVRSGTSVGANYMEADGAESRKDFEYKIAVCKKEAKETMHWLRMIARANPQRAKECRELWKETHELALIFSSIVRSAKSKKTRLKT